MDDVAMLRAYFYSREQTQRIMKERVENGQGRICASALETLKHLISRCTVIAPVQYTIRHNAECKVIHQNLAYKHWQITGICPVYRYEPEAVHDSYSM